MGISEVQNWYVKIDYDLNYHPCTCKQLRLLPVKSKINRHLGSWWVEHTGYMMFRNNLLNKSGVIIGKHVFLQPRPVTLTADLFKKQNDWSLLSDEWYIHFDPQINRGQAWVMNDTVYNVPFITETWRGVRVIWSYSSTDKPIFFCFLFTFFSILGQQHFSAIFSLLEWEILITFANFNTSQM